MIIANDFHSAGTLLIFSLVLSVLRCTAVIPRRTIQTSKASRKTQFGISTPNILNFFCQRWSQIIFLKFLIHSSAKSF